jgi:hypothetical protein
MGAQLLGFSDAQHMGLHHSMLVWCHWRYILCLAEACGRRTINEAD